MSIRHPSSASRCVRVIGIAVAAILAEAAARVALAQEAPQAAAAAQASGPQHTLAEVIVTAEKRTESERDVPSTVTVLTGAELAARGLTDLRGYSATVPGMVYSGTSFVGERSGPDITIRGVSNSRLFDFETSIATTTTGFVYGEVPAYAFDPDVVDIQRIEILKGPQGTLYGAASMGGTVKVVPNPPRFDAFSSTVEGGYSLTDGGGQGSSNSYHVATIVNVPLSHVLAARFSAYHNDDGGYINAKFVRGIPGEIRGNDTTVPQVSAGNGTVYGIGQGNPYFARNINGDTVDGGRVALRYKPNERFDATLAAFYQTKNEHSLPNYEPALATSTSALNTELYMLQPSTTNYALTSLQASYDAGPFSVHSVTGWLDRRFTNATDFTGITYSALGGDGTVPVPTPAPVTFLVGTKVFSQEFRLQGTRQRLADWAGLDWTVGYFYQKEMRDASGGVTVGPEWFTEAKAPLMPPPSGTTTVWEGEYWSTYKNNSVFANITLHLFDRVGIEFGERRSQQTLDSRRIDFGNVFAGASTPDGTTLDVRSIDESQWTPRAAVTYAVADKVNVYASAAKGFRIGGGNPQSNLSTAGCQAALRALGITNTGVFKSDSIWNYEIGTKGDLAGGRVHSDLALYDIEWSDLQTSVSLSNYSSTCGASIVANAGKARIRGVDYEARALLTDHLQLAFAGQWADGKIVEAAPGTAAKDGDPTKNTPKWSANVALEYRFNAAAEYGATARADYTYVGSRSFNDIAAGVSPALMLPSYSLINLRLTVDHGSWQYATFLDNVANQHPELGVTTLPGGPGNYAGAYAPGLQRFVGTSRPRTIGIEVSKDF